MTDRTAEPWPPIFSQLRYADPIAAVEWLCRVFRFREEVRLSGPNGDLYISELMGPAGGWLMVSGTTPAYKDLIARTVPGFHDSTDLPWPNLSHSTTVIVDDVDDHFEHARSEGATIFTEPTDQPWGHRAYEAFDLEGHHWDIAQQLRDAAPEEWGATRVGS